MPEIPDLIRLLIDPENNEALHRVFGEPERLNIDDDLLPHKDDQPFLLREVVCELLGDLGPAARAAVPALMRCIEDETNSTVSRFTQLAAVAAIWKITGDPLFCIPICERLLLDEECWHRRYIVEFLEEVGHPALPALRRRMEIDQRYEVREAARKALEKIWNGLS